MDLQLQELVPTVWRFSLLAQRSCSSLVSWPLGSGSVGNLRVSLPSLNQYRNKTATLSMVWCNLTLQRDSDPCCCGKQLWIATVFLSPVSPSEFWWFLQFETSWSQTKLRRHPPSVLFGRYFLKTSRPKNGMVHKGTREWQKIPTQHLSNWFSLSTIASSDTDTPAYPPGN